MHNEVPQVVLQVLAILGAVTVVMLILKFLEMLEWRFTHPRCINCQREHDRMLDQGGPRRKHERNSKRLS
jgi:hypothetical protein